MNAYSIDFKDVIFDAKLWIILNITFNFSIRKVAWCSIKCCGIKFWMALNPFVHIIKKDMLLVRQGCRSRGHIKPNQLILVHSPGFFKPSYRPFRSPKNDIKSPFFYQTVSTIKFFGQLYRWFLWLWIFPIKNITVVFSANFLTVVLTKENLFY